MAKSQLQNPGLSTYVAGSTVTDFRRRYGNSLGGIIGTLPRSCIIRIGRSSNLLSVRVKADRENIRRRIGSTGTAIRSDRERIYPIPIKGIPGTTALPNLPRCSSPTGDPRGH